MRYINFEQYITQYTFEYIKIESTNTLTARFTRSRSAWRIKSENIIGRMIYMKMIYNSNKVAIAIERTGFQSIKSRQNSHIWYSKDLHPQNCWMYQFGHWWYWPFKTRGYTCTCLASAHDISKTRGCVTNRVPNSVFPTTKLSSHDACIKIALMSGQHKARYHMNWATCTWC